MFIEIKSGNCGIADMRPPYHLSFTGLGTKALKGAKGDKGDKGVSDPYIGEFNDSLNNRNLAMQNKVSNVGENLKEGKSLFFQSYQFATLPVKSVSFAATPVNIPVPKGTNQWVIDFTNLAPTSIGTYVFKLLFFYKLNPFTDTTKQKYRIITKVTGADGTVYDLPYDYDLNDWKSEEIQKKTFSNFTKLFADLNPSNAPYTYGLTIQGLDGSEGSLLIETESAGTPDPAIPSASHFEFIEMIPRTDKLVRDKDVHFSDPNIYTAEGYVLPDTPEGGKDDSIPPLLVYAIKDVPYTETVKKVLDIGEDVSGNITKVLINSPVDIEVNNQKIVDLKEGVLDTDAVNVKQLKEASGVAAKQSYKDLVSVDKFLLDAYIGTLDGFSRGVWKTADLGLIKTFESWVDGTQIVTDQLKLTLTNAITGGGTLPNGKEYFIDIKNIETSDTIQNKVMDDLTHEYNEETVSIKFNLRKNATNIFLDIVSYTEGTLVGKLNSIDIEIDLIKLKGAKALKGDKGDPGGGGTLLYESDTYVDIPAGSTHTFTYTAPPTDIKIFDEIKASIKYANENNRLGRIFSISNIESITGDVFDYDTIRAGDSNGWNVRFIVSGSSIKIENYSSSPSGTLKVKLSKVFGLKY